MSAKTNWNQIHDDQFTVECEHNQYNHWCTKKRLAIQASPEPKLIMEFVLCSITNQVWQRLVHLHHVMDRESDQYILVHEEVILQEA